MKTYTDADRERLAVCVENQHGSMMVGPSEWARCPFGNFYTYRWVWPVGTDIGEAEPSGACCCSKCLREEDEL